MKTDEIYRIKQSIKSELIKKGYSEDEVGNLLEDYPELIRRLNTVELPDWFKEHLVCWYDPEKQGCTNENMDVADPILKDFNPTPRGVDPNTQLPTGEKCDMHLKNFGWSGMSGIGEYGLLSIKKDFLIAKHVFINNPNSVTIKNITKDYPFLSSYSLRKEFKVKIEGIQDIGLSYQYRDDKNNSFYINIEKDGDYILPENRFETLNGFRGLQDGECNITITQIPLRYSNALVFDGVDDYGISENQPKLTDYTLFCKREIVKKGSGSIIGKRDNNISFDCAFLFENNENRTYSFSVVSTVNILNNNITSIQSTNSYNGTYIDAKVKDDNRDSNYLSFGCSDISSKKNNQFALYKFLLFDITLTQEQIDYVKYVIMGEPLPEPIAKWSAKGKTNEDADKDVLKDLTGNGHDIALKNFAFSGMSGYGGYGTDFRDWIAYQGLTNRTSSSFTISIAEGAENQNILKTEIICDKEIEVFIYGITNNYNLDFEYYSDSGILIQKQLKNGYNILPVNRIKGNRWGFAIHKWNKTAHINFNVKQIPEYPDSLVFDGVDDYGICENMPIFTPDKGYTVIAKRENLFSTPNPYQVLFNAISTRVEYYDAYENLNEFVAKSFGPNTHNSLSENSVIWQNSTMYCGMNINKGLSKTSNIIKIFSLLKGAFYELHVFDHDLTPTEIELYIKRNIDKGYKLPPIEPPTVQETV